VEEIHVHKKKPCAQRNSYTVLFPARKWIEMKRNGFVLFVSNPDSDLLNPFLSN